LTASLVKLLHRGEAGRLQERVCDPLDDRAVRLGFGTLAMPFRVGLEGVPLLFAVGERVPFQQVIERLVRVADQRGPKPGLMDAVLLPQRQRDRVESLQQIRQTARHAVIDAQFIDHGALPCIIDGSMRRPPPGGKMSNRRMGQGRCARSCYCAASLWFCWSSAARSTPSRAPIRKRSPSSPAGSGYAM